MSGFADLFLVSLPCVCPYCQTIVFVHESAFDEEGYVDLECYKCANITTYKLTESEGDIDDK